MEFDFFKFSNVFTYITQGNIIHTFSVIHKHDALGTVKFTENSPPLASLKIFDRNGSPIVVNSLKIGDYAVSKHIVIWLKMIVIKRTKVAQNQCRGQCFCYEAKVDLNTHIECSYGKLRTAAAAVWFSSITKLKLSFSFQIWLFSVAACVQCEIFVDIKLYYALCCPKLPIRTKPSTHIFYLQIFRNNVLTTPLCHLQMPDSNIYNSREFNVKIIFHPNTGITEDEQLLCTAAAIAYVSLMFPTSLNNNSIFSFW